MRDALVEYMMAQIEGDRELQAKVIPDYPATGKRILMDDGSWLRCLRKDNVELERTGIKRITPDGVITVDGRFRRPTSSVTQPVSGTTTICGR